MTILENVRAKAEEQNISISALEKKANIGNGTIARWDRTKPMLQSVIKVAGVFGCTVDELLKE